MKTFVISLVVSHFVFDWIFQTRKIARTKSSSLKSLGIHLLIYFVGIFLTVLFFSDGIMAWHTLWFLSIINITTHGIIDWNIWSLAKKFLSNYEGDTREYLFYSIIALDQILHLVILFLLFL